MTYNGYVDASVTASAINGTGVTFTASAGVFAATDVGNRIRYGTNYALITGYTSGTVVTADITGLFPLTAIEQGAWSIATDNLTGLTHLEGETVWIWADGAVQPEKVVASGGITLNGFVSYANVGLPYDNYMILLPVEAPQFGTIQGRIRNISRILPLS